MSAAFENQAFGEGVILVRSRAAGGISTGLRLLTFRKGSARRVAGPHRARPGHSPR
jgi:hypothetical protein